MDFLFVLLVFALLASIIILISMSWTQLRGAPWLPTPLIKVHRMLNLAQIQPGDTLYDLGCGDGRVVVMAARNYNACAVGIELDPLRYLWCQLLVWVLGLRGKVCIIRGDFFKQDLSQADVVTCYLLQSTNDRLEKKLLSELKPGARVVSHAFTFSNMQQIGSDTRSDLYAYRIPEKPNQETGLLT